MDDQVLDTFDTAQLIPDFDAPQLPSERPDRETLEAADHNTRHWTSRESGPLTPGSDAHRREACRMFRETFNPYRPSVLEWPRPAPAAPADHAEARALRTALHAQEARGADELKPRRTDDDDDEKRR